MSKPTLWGFGDSFTEGCGIFQRSRSYRVPPYGNVYKNCRFLTQLGRDLGLPVKNCGAGGSSNQSIRETIIENLQYIKEGDTVIIGASVPTRFPLQVTVDGKVDIQSGFIGRIDLFLNNEKHPLQEENIFKVFSREELKVIRDYYLTIFPKQEEVYFKRDIKLFQDFQSYFKTNNIKCILWDYTCWLLFESIENWTKQADFGVVMDGHWSPNGHMGFKEVLLKALKDEVDYVNYRIIVDGRWLEECIPLNEYIPALLTYYDEKVVSLI